MAPVLEAVAARHRGRLPDRRHPAGRRDTDLQLLLHGAQALYAPEQFGKGAIEGSPGRSRQQRLGRRVLVPMLTLGLPTSATAAIMLSAFQSYGINPGPLLHGRSRSWSGA